MIGSLEQAADLYRDFRGMEPDQVVYEQLPGEINAMHMGTVAGIAYDTVRDGKSEKYYHAFKPWAGPSLNASADGRTLILTGGKFEVTDRGIVDMPKGRKSNPLVAIVNDRARGEPARKVALPMAKTRSKRKARPAPARKRKARQEVIVMAPNPVKKRRRRNPVTVLPVRTRKRRRNPIGGGLHLGGKGMFNPFELIVPGIMEAAGAIASDMVTAVAPVPDNWKTGPLKGLTNIGIGAAIGLGVAKFISRKAGVSIAKGAIVLGGYNFLRGLVQEKLPNIPLSGYPDGMGGWIQTPGLNGFIANPQVGSYADDMGGWVNADDLGAYTASQVSPDVGLSDLINR